MQRIFILLLLLGFFTQGIAQQFDPPRQGFTSWKPAPQWEDALLSGNGTMGTLTFGVPHNETIIVNHSLFYLPNWTPLPPIDQASRLEEIRQLISRGEYEQAASIPVEQSLKEGYEEMKWIDPFVPFCNIRMEMAPGNVKDYVRMTDFATGESKVQWMQDGSLYQRRLFVSRADSMVVMSVTAQEKINLTVSLRQHPVSWEQREYVNNAIKWARSTAENGFLTFRTEFNNQWDGNPQGFEGVALVKPIGGEVSYQGSEMIITNADEVLFYMTVNPNYQFANSLIEEMKLDLESKKNSYQDFLDRHVAIHGDLFSRVKLDLGGGKESNLQTDAFVIRARHGSTPAIIERQFDAARYNIISSTGTNPPNLQGIWSGTWTPPWSSGFTHDGNVEVAVSHLLSANTPELMEAYLGYHERMMPYYRDNAKRLFGTRGIHVPAHSSSHGWNIHFDKTWTLSLWSGGAGWASGILYDYYLYTGDLDLLRNRIYPFMKESAWFYEDFLIKGENGKYVFSPSYSPENNPSNSKSQLVKDATSDVMIARELLRNCIEAGKKVGESRAQIRIWEEMLKHMPDYRINEAGELAEWLPAKYEENHSHRHVSQLYSLFELIAPEFKNNPEMMDAARNAAEARMVHRRRAAGGEMVFGLAQLGMVTANMGNNQLTAEIIDLISRYYWAPSMATYHNSGHLFNMDVSGGFPAVILRSLAYSEPGKVNLLPALSPGWDTGSLHGMALRGQLVMEHLVWSPDGVDVQFLSPIDQTIELTVPHEIKNFTSSINRSVSAGKRTAKETLTVKLKAGQSNSITIKY